MRLKILFSLAFCVICINVSAAEKLSEAKSRIESPRETASGGELVGYWSFDEGKGNGEIIGAEFIKGKIGSALQFNGENNYVEIESDEKLNLAKEITIMAWINPSSDHKGDVLRKSDAYGLRTDTGGTLLGYIFGKPGIAAPVSVSGAIPAKTWSHVAFTYDQKKLKIYKNGELLLTRDFSSPINISENPITIGGKLFYFAGIIDDVKIYNRALTETEILKQEPVLMEMKLEEKEKIEKSKEKFKEFQNYKEDKVCETLENEYLKLEFIKVKEKSILMKTYVKSNQQWIKISEQPEGIYLVIYSPDIKIGHTFEFNERNVLATFGGAREVYHAGEPYWTIPSSYEKIDENKIRLSYEEKDLFKLEIIWQLEKGKKHAKVSYKLTSLKDGYYTSGYHGFCPKPLEEVNQILLPYLWHSKRFPKEASLLVDAFTPTPLSLFEFNIDTSTLISCSLVADPEKIPFEWPDKERSNYGFLIRNISGEVQPAIFSPVLGSKNSYLKNKESYEGSFYYLALPQDWFSAYCYIVKNIFKLKDYRHNYGHSLNEAIFNTIDLFMNDEYGGWWKEAKGSYQIESGYTVTIASPLLPLELYLLTGDKEIYYRRTLPAIEYALSRPGPHFTPFTEKKEGMAYGYGHCFSLSASSSWSPVVFCSLYMMSRNLTDKFYYNASSKKSNDWKDLLFMYLSTNEEKYLNEAKERCETFLKDVYVPKYGAPTFWHNLHFVPDQWRLIDMYEITGEKKYLDAQVEEAKWLLTNVWTQPVIPEEKITIHPGGKYTGCQSKWITWKGTGKYRLGLGDGVEYHKLEERKIDAWIPSQAGLSFEHITTYANAGNIFMSAWAPHLLRLYQHTGNSIFYDYARNAILGRWSNYPGYYVNGFTDLYMSPEYPYKGPDVTIIYYHHILPFLAFNIDFLITEAMVRSNGEINFPWAVQTGYAWFTNRVYGFAPGSFYGDKDAWLWFKKGLVNIDTYKLNYLTAHSKNKLYLFLMNEENEEVKANISINESLIGFTPGKEYLLTTIKDNKKETSFIKEAKFSVSVSPKGVVALIIDGVNIDIPIHSFTAKKMDLEKQKESFADIPNAGKPFGEIHASLIMVEPSSYSAYAFITATDKEIKKAKLYWSVGNDKYQNIEKGDYPFEFSVVNLDPSFPFNFYIEVEDKEGKVYNSEKYTLRVD